MTNDRRKSDRPTVPVKSPNKAGKRSISDYGKPYTGTKTETSDTAKGEPTGRGSHGTPAAEGMEGRGLAKGNSREQTMLRTQGRDRMQQALERVRQAAVRDRKLQFTALHAPHLQTRTCTSRGLLRPQSRTPQRAWTG